jgi:hypothetical protein
MAGAIVGGVIAIAGTAVGVQQNKKAQDAAEDRDEVGQAQAALANQRAIRQSVAANNLQRARLLASGQAQGAGDSSAVSGALASSQTQAGANIGFARQTQAASSAINAATSRQRTALGNAATAQAVGSLPGQFGLDPLRTLGKRFGQQGQADDTSSIG